MQPVFRTRMCRKSCGAPQWRPVRNNDRFIEHPGSTHSEHPTAARYSNAGPRASERSRRCDFPAPIWAPFGGSSAFRYGRYTTKVPRSSASRLSEFASYGGWATLLGSTPGCNRMPNRSPRHSRLIWVLADIVGLFSINVGPFSPNVGRDHRIFSANLGPKRRMLSGRAVYVIGPLQVRTGMGCGEAPWMVISVNFY